jgi:hypothetical protein
MVGLPIFNFVIDEDMTAADAAAYSTPSRLNNARIYRKVLALAATQPIVTR